ncbi:MAG: imidazole glycerol phosphate synthase subunit HisH [Pseudomonadota bacterium]
MSTIGIIDYGVGNLGSLERAFEEIGANAQLITTPEAIAECAAMVLPGVGAFTDCMAMLHAQGWVDGIGDAVATGKPLLGVCVGMQLLADAGEEGADGASTPGLGLVPGQVSHLRCRGCEGPVPHVGWNALAPTPAGAGLFQGIPDGTDVYFVHSYTFVPEDDDPVLAFTDYGVSIVAAVNRGNVWGTQFHPEKSGRAGFQILRNFRGLAGC